MDGRRNEPMGTILFRWCSVLFFISTTATSSLFGNNTLFWTTKKNGIFILDQTEEWANNVKTPTARWIPINSTSHKLVGCSTHYERDFLVFSDSGTNTIFLVGPNPENKLRGVYVHIGTSKGVGQITVDWVSGNVYWADSVFGWIGLQALPSSILTATHNEKLVKFKIIVERNLEIPVGVSVHPVMRYLFWSDVGQQSKIERSSLHGESREVLVWSGLIKPVSLAVDVNANLLYWADPGKGTVEFVDLDGGNRRVLLSSRSATFFSVETYKNLVFAANQFDNTVYAVSRIDGQTVPRALHLDPISPSAPPYSLTMFSQSNQPLTQSACQNVSYCDHICIHMGGTDNAACLCEDGFNLNNDARTCTAETEVLQRSVLYTKGNTVCAIDVTVINSHGVGFTPTCIAGRDSESTEDISFFAVDVDRKRLYYSIGQKIFMQLFFSASSQLLYTSGRGEIKGLDYDWKQRRLIWTEEHGDSLYTAELAESTSVITAQEVLLSGLVSPAALAVDPHSRRVFWISSSIEPSINVIYLESSQNEVIEQTNLRGPTRIVYDRLNDRLHWTDSGDLSSIKTDGSERRKTQLDASSSYSGVAVYKDYLIWGKSSNEGAGIMIDDGLSDNPVYVPLPNVTRILDVRMYAENLQNIDLDPCVWNNGGCQHICLSSGSGSVCKCKFGYDLGVDQKTCNTVWEEFNFHLVLDSLNRNIYQVPTVSRHIAALDISADEELVAVTYDLTRKRLIWSNTIGIIKARVQADAEVVLSSQASTISYGLDVDGSTGNVYYTANNSVSVMSAGGNVVKTLVSGLHDARAVVLHPKEGYMLWTERGAPARISKASMDGAPPINHIVTQNIQSPRGLTLDHDESKLYWCDDELDKIEIVDVNTFAAEILRSHTGEYPVTVSVLGDYLYFIGRNQRGITKIDKISGGKAVGYLESPLFGRLETLSYYNQFDDYKNEICADKNGRCSTLCLSSSSGRTCACGNGIRLKDDDRTCTGVIQCPTDITNGVLTGDCTAYAGSVCTVQCSDGYTHHDTSSVTCNPNGKWDVSPASVCSKVGALPQEALIGIVAGSVAVVILGGMILAYCLFRRFRRKPGDNSSPQADPVVHFRSQDSNMAQAEGNLNPAYTSSVKRPSEAESVYSQIPADAEENRYSTFPKNHQERRASGDYFEVLPDDVHDGYLIPSPSASVRDNSVSYYYGMTSSSLPHDMHGSSRPVGRAEMPRLTSSHPEPDYERDYVSSRSHLHHVPPMSRTEFETPSGYRLYNSDRRYNDDYITPSPSSSMKTS